MTKKKEVKTSMTIQPKDVYPYIVKAGEDLDDQLSIARQKYGNRYNRKNKYEQMYSKFGIPEDHPEQFYNEYVLITQKKSNLPASLREPVKEVCQMAVQMLINDLRAAAAAKEKQIKSKEK